MRISPFLLALAALALPSRVYAQEATGGPVAPATTAPSTSSESEAAIARGVALRRARRDAEALVEFRAAYAIDPTPRPLAQIALAEAALERWVVAEVDLTRVLATGDPWVERQREALTVALRAIQSHLGALDLSGNDGAEVWVDGELAGHLPSPALRVVAKPELVVELRAPGFLAARHVVAVNAGEVVHARWLLEPAPKRPPDPVATVPDDAPAAPVRGSPPTPAWVAAGGAAAFLAGGIASTVIAANAASDYDGPGCGARPSVTCASDASRVRTAEAFEAVGYIGAGAGAVVSALLFLAAPRPTTTARAVRCEPTGAGLRCGLVF